jgi:hypothetical protein
MHSVGEHPPAVRLTIPGKFWDSQVYSGTLYLFDMSGGLWTLDWDELVARIRFPETLRVAADLALRGNQRLYEAGAQLLLQDSEIRRLLQNKFNALSIMPPWEIGLQKERIADNPLPFPHNDSEVHYHRLYVGASDGLYTFLSTDNGNSAETIQMSEAPALRIAAKLRTMAQAAGGDGLFAVQLSEGNGRSGGARPNIQVSTLPCATCEWAFNSVVAAGYDNSIYVAPFELTDNEGSDRRKRRTQRTFKHIIRDDEIFKEDNPDQRGFSWGAGDRLFRFAEGHIGVIEYTPRTNKAPRFDFKGSIELDDTEMSSDIVAARAAPFGSVIEKDNSLVVLLSSNHRLDLEGEPTNWRVFPRSKNYINHLHVIYNDRLEIWAFTHDYFVDQAEKLSGIGSASAE